MNFLYFAHTGIIVVLGLLLIIISFTAGQFFTRNHSKKKNSVQVAFVILKSYVVGFCRIIVYFVFIYFITAKENHPTFLSYIFLVPIAFYLFFTIFDSEQEILNLKNKIKYLYWFFLDSCTLLVSKKLIFMLYPIILEQKESTIPPDFQSIIIIYSVAYFFLILYFLFVFDSLYKKREQALLDTIYFSRNIMEYCYEFLGVEKYEEQIKTDRHFFITTTFNRLQRLCLERSSAISLNRYLQYLTEIIDPPKKEKDYNSLKIMKIIWQFIFSSGVLTVVLEAIKKLSYSKNFRELLLLIGIYLPSILAAMIIFIRFSSARKRSDLYRKYLTNLNKNIEYVLELKKAEKNSPLI